MCYITQSSNSAVKAYHVAIYAQTIKGFITLTTGVYVIKLFSSSLKLLPNRLECFSLEGFFIIVHYFGEGTGAHPKSGASKGDPLRWA